MTAVQERISFADAIIADKIGTVTAVALPSEFQFQLNLNKDMPLLQDFVVTPSPQGDEIPLLAKIVRISRFNPLLPEESALELARMAVDTSFAPLPLFGKMEMVAAACQVLGSLDERGKLKNPGFPVKPGNSVFLPSPRFMQLVLSGIEPLDNIHTGQLRNRPDIKCSVNANEILNKHLAILAMTGAGKTYAASVFMEEVMKKGYPLLIIDPHADYINLGTRKAGEQFDYRAGPKTGKYRLRVFDESIDVTDLGDNEFIDFVEGVAEEEITAAQRSKYKEACYNNRKEGLRGIDAIREYLDGGSDDGDDEGKTKKTERGGADRRTVGAMKRQLRSVSTLLSNVKSTLTIAEIEKQLGLGKGVVLNMSSLPSQIQRVNAQIILQKVFEKRKTAVLDKQKGFPPVFIVVEEAHNFAPAQTEDEVFPTRGILRRIATEGRKFGIGLCVISQRPSRLDSTVLSQCNSQVILRVVNPNDQIYIRQTVESLATTDLMALPDLSEGEALLSGAMVPIPSVIRIRERESREGVPAVNRLREIQEYD